jgi:hypothetical protein
MGNVYLLYIIETVQEAILVEHFIKLYIDLLFLLLSKTEKERENLLISIA